MTNLRNSVESLDQDNFNKKKEKYLHPLIYQCIKIKKNIHAWMIQAKVYEALDQVIKYLSTHPILLVICVSIIAVFVIPIFLFVLFAVINVAFAFTGFLVVEVAVLSVAVTVLCSMLFCLISLIAIIGIFCVITWALACYGLAIMRSIKNKTIPHNKSS